MKKLRRTKFILLLVAAVFLTTLSGCGEAGDLAQSQISSDSKLETHPSDTEPDTPPSEEALSSSKDEIAVTPTAAKSVELELYETADFSLQIPKGWTVTSGGTGMYHSIRVQDPAEPLNQIFVLLKADALLHSQEGKDAWAYYSGISGVPGMQIFALAPVLSTPSTENFFKIFPQYADFAVQAEPGYTGYTFPRFEGFAVTERFPSTGGLSAYALNDEILRATFTEGGKEGEGMFAASVVDFGSAEIAAGPPVGYQIPSADGGYYMAYNVMAVTAVKDSFLEWIDILTECARSLEYSESYVNAVKQAGTETVARAMEFSRNANEVLDGIMSSWENRNTSQDIISQKQSDATLGYERICDTETGEIYKAENGWSDGYHGDRYQLVSEDSMYLEPISGYID